MIVRGLKRGLSLLEIIVSLIVLSVGFLATLTVIGQLYRLNKRIGYYYIAYNLAREPIEYIESVRYQHTSWGKVYYEGTKYKRSSSACPSVVNLNSELEELRAGSLSSPKLLPPHPESLYLEWDLFMYYPGGVSPKPVIRYIPKVVFGESDCNVDERYELGEEIAYVNSFVSWKNAEGKREGVVLGVIPFRYYNGTSNSVALRIDTMTIE